ncbi:hypothetical protein [Rhodobacter maris]|nr:hypothetical protein [Rhodobacter maris]
MIYTAIMGAIAGAVASIWMAGPFGRGLVVGVILGIIGTLKFGS